MSLSLARARALSLRMHVQGFLNRFRCEIDLWETELAEKRSLRSTILEQLEVIVFTDCIIYPRRPDNPSQQQSVRV